jgi:hypothetical protein
MLIFDVSEFTQNAANFFDASLTDEVNYNTKDVNN